MTRAEEMTLSAAGNTLPAEAGSPGWLVVVNVLVVLAGIALRWAQLGKLSLRFDEGYTAWAVDHPLGEIIRIIRVDTAPPLYYLLLRGWVLLFGFSEAALRSMSALMASIALLVFVPVARRLLKSTWALALSIWLFSFSFMQIGYAHEARFYSMMTMLGVIDFYLVLLVCQRSTKLRLALLVIAWSVSLYTNNMMLVYLACLGMSWLVLPGERKFWGRVKDAAVVSVISGLIFLPWLPTLLNQSRRLAGGGFWPSVPDRWMLAHTGGMLAGIHNESFPHGNLHWYLQLDLVLIGLTCALLVSRSAWRIGLGLVAFGCLPIILIFFYSRFSTPIFMERAFIISSAVFPLIIALATEAVSIRLARWVCIGAAVLFLYLGLRSLSGHRLGEYTELWGDAVAFAQQGKAVHRLVICVDCDGEPLYRYYGCGRDYGPRADVTGAPTSFYATDPPITMRRVKQESELQPLAERIAHGGFDEVVVISSHAWWGDPNGLTVAMVSRQMQLVASRTFKLITVYRFKPRVAVTQP
jgi:hypothetical protein